MIGGDFFGTVPGVGMGFNAEDPEDSEGIERMVAHVSLAIRHDKPVKLRSMDSRGRLSPHEVVREKGSVALTLECVLVIFSVSFRIPDSKIMF